MIPTDTNMPKEANERVHLGRNVRRLREMLGMKQEGLASELGDDWTQKKVSLLEQKETIEDELLEEVAKALKLPVEAIKNFSEDAAIYNIQNNYDGSNNHGANMNYHYTFNPLDKYVEQVEENKKLYQALLKEKDEKIALLERMFERK
jgi:transcriptional regulator with XRE-family HTH domain